MPTLNARNIARIGSRGARVQSGARAHHTVPAASVAPRSPRNQRSRGSSPTRRPPPSICAPTSLIAGGAPRRAWPAWGAAPPPPPPAPPAPDAQAPPPPGLPPLFLLSPGPVPPPPADTPFRCHTPSQEQSY